MQAPHADCPPQTRKFPFLSPLWSGTMVGCLWALGGQALSPWFLRITPREEKTEQLVDTRHEVDQLALELQKVKQEVSRKGWACVEGTTAAATLH